MTPLSWLLCVALLIAECLAYRWLAREYGRIIGLGRPATFAEMVVWELVRLEERASKLNEVDGGVRGWSE